MKSIKIADDVHTELKIYAAKSKNNIYDFAGYAIMALLKDCGHKFVLPKSKSKTKPSKAKQ